MAKRSRRGHVLGRRFLLRAGAPLALVALVSALLAGGGSSAGASSVAPPRFSALDSTAPSGLPLVEPHASQGSGGPSGPTFPEQPPADATSWPVASSIRRVPLSEPGLSAWIARSSDGGVCVLLYDGVPVDGVNAIDMGCSALEGGAARGASVEVSEIPGMPGKVIAAGVVPDGVSAVSETMADGSTRTSAVSDDAWSRVTDEPAAADEQPTEIAGG